MKAEKATNCLRVSRTGVQLGREHASKTLGFLNMAI